MTAIYQHLIELHASGRKVILIVDEAQALTDNSLETVRLLTNLETESSKLLQVVLFAQPELDERLNKAHLRQLKQRISFSYSLPLMNRDDLDIYIHYRLAVAGYTHGNLFTKKARNLLYKASRGIPRIVNVLSHKALLVAYGQGVHEINYKTMRIAVRDTDSARRITKRTWISIGLGASIFVLLALILIY